MSGNHSRGVRGSMTESRGRWGPFDLAWFYAMICLGLMGIIIDISRASQTNDHHGRSDSLSGEAPVYEKGHARHPGSGLVSLKGKQERDCGR